MGAQVPGLQIDTLSKIVKIYFAGVISQEFEYQGEVFRPKKITVSPLIFRGTTCPMTCGGCCFRFSLVWLPGEPKDLGPAVERVLITVNGVERWLYVDPQQDHKDHFCRHLNKTNGLCGIYPNRPFSCDFELIRVVHTDRTVNIATRQFGRGWSYTRVTGQKGALCHILPVSPERVADAARKLRRLQEWTDYFALKTHLPQIIRWVETGPHEVPLVIRPGTRSLTEV